MDGLDAFPQLREHLRLGPSSGGMAGCGMFEPQLRYLEDELGRVLALDDTRDGIAASLGKRAPVWTGT